MFVGGASGASAQVAKPNTGSTACTSAAYVHQVTKYHGTICYKNSGYDDLGSSGFWTTELDFGANSGYFKYRLTTGGTVYTEPYTAWTSLIGAPGSELSLVGLCIAPCRLPDPPRTGRLARDPDRVAREFKDRVQPSAVGHNSRQARWCQTAARGSRPPVFRRTIFR